MASWTITEDAKHDYLSLRRLDPRGCPGDRALLLRELADDVEWTAQRKVGRQRRDGRIVYRGRKARRYQFVVDPRTDPPTLVSVRRECEVRTAGPRKSHRR